LIISGICHSYRKLTNTKGFKEVRELAKWIYGESRFQIEKTVTACSKEASMTGVKPGNRKGRRSDSRTNGAPLMQVLAVTSRSLTFTQCEKPW
jgi:hypothetical protein